VPVKEPDNLATRDVRAVAMAPTEPGALTLDDGSGDDGSVATFPMSPGARGSGGSGDGGDGWIRAVAAGTVLGGRYEVGAHLGSGGMGTVYAARDRLLDMPVALKFVRPALARDLREQGRLWQEVRLAQTITHVNVVRTYTLEQHDGHLFIVMELLDGVSLADAVASGPLPLDEALRIVRGVLAGLAAAHGKSIVHRDIKPQNTRVCSDGRVVVMDFGIARAYEASAPPPAAGEAPSGTTFLAGTPGYIAPEILAGDRATALADLYAVGVLLYEMIVGKRPSASTTVLPTPTGAAAVTASLEISPELAVLPPRLAAVMRRLLAADPAQRYQSVDDVVRALDRATQAEEPPAVAPAAPVPHRPRGWLLGLATIALAAIASAAAAWLVRAAPPPPARHVAPPPSPSPSPSPPPSPSPSPPPSPSPSPPPSPEPAPAAASTAEPAAPEPARRSRRHKRATKKRTEAPATAPATDEAAERRRKLLDLDEDKP